MQYVKIMKNIHMERIKMSQVPYDETPKTDSQTSQPKIVNMAIKLDEKVKIAKPKISGMVVKIDEKVKNFLPQFLLDAVSYNHESRTVNLAKARAQVLSILTTFGIAVPVQYWDIIGIAMLVIYLIMGFFIQKFDREGTKNDVKKAADGQIEEIKRQILEAVASDKNDANDTDKSTYVEKL